eukprot:6021528-Prymnesium_polylepis.1
MEMVGGVVVAGMAPYECRRRSYSRSFSGISPANCEHGENQKSVRGQFRAGKVCSVTGSHS